MLMCIACSTLRLGQCNQAERQNAADSGQSRTRSKATYWQLAKPPLVCLFVNSSLSKYTSRDMYIYVCYVF